MRAEDAYVGLGSNLGESRATLEQAIAELARLPGTTLVARSALYRSAPVGARGPDFINAAARLRTTLAPRALLAELHRIETAHGRERPEPNAPRTLDLDLLLHGQGAVNAPDLVVPHPRMHERAFVLMPLAEIVPGLVIAGLGTVEALLGHVAGQRVDRL